ncbi:hypothetical protein L3Y34_014809 [Caenorhabditis briggsae]|uniref:Uncharacterized protein n=1 Tax=Caenorhabditis briggsae TaxID=6238 RepID=A0AAE9DSU1_CAEBR|nr:hypothetical protein L3Y34_014809 [Caenorhabditis briggsae]
MLDLAGSAWLPEDGVQGRLQDWCDLIQGDRKRRVKRKGMLGLQDNLQQLRGQTTYAAELKERNWLVSCTTFQGFEDIIRIGRIHIKMTEVPEQNEKIRMSQEKGYRVAVVMSELCELFFLVISFFLASFARGSSFGYDFQ